MKTKTSPFILSALFFYLLSFIPLVNYLKVSYFILLLLSLALIVFDLFVNKHRVPFYFYVFAFLEFSLSSFTSLYWGGSFKIVLYPLPMVVGLYLSLQIDTRDYSSVTDFFSFFSYVLLCGAIIGELYSLSGHGPLFSFTNPDGRTSWFYLTTFTNVRIGNVIRPSGIFDEPGAFSFFLSITCFLRVINNKPKLGTWIILISGLITISLAHIIIILTFFFYINYHSKKNISLVVFAILLLLIIILFTNVGKEVFSLIWDRMPWTETSGRISKEERSGALKVGLDLLSQKEGIRYFLFGVDGHFLDPAIPATGSFSKFDSTPLSPILFYGFLISWPYYLLEILLCFAAIRQRENFYLLGLALLIAQRPSLTVMGYAWAIFMPYIMHINMRNKGKFGEANIGDVEL